MAGKKITKKIDGKDYSIDLTDKEVKSIESIFNTGSEAVIVMKKHNGGAMFFTSEVNADNCMARHGFEFAMVVELKDIKK